VFAENEPIDCFSFSSCGSNVIYNCGLRTVVLSCDPKRKLDLEFKAPNRPFYLGTLGTRCYLAGLHNLALVDPKTKTEVATFFFPLGTYYATNPDKSIAAHGDANLIRLLDVCAGKKMSCFLEGEEITSIDFVDHFNLVVLSKGKVFIYNLPEKR